MGLIVASDNRGELLILNQETGVWERASSFDPTEEYYE